MSHRCKLLPYVGATALFYLFTCAASAAELQLAGVRLGRSALTVIQKYGNPSEVRVGAAGQTEITGANVAPGMPASAEGLMGMALPGMSASESGMPSPFGPPSGFTSMPGAAQPPGQPVIQKRAPEVMWIYRFAQNKTLEFLINPDGRVLQIAAYGAEWPGIGTAKGIRLGDTYKDVLVKYGFPESHEKRGLELIAKYPERDRALFTLVGNTVVGITIALMD